MTPTSSNKTDASLGQHPTSLHTLLLHTIDLSTYLKGLTRPLCFGFSFRQSQTCFGFSCKKKYNESAVGALEDATGSAKTFPDIPCCGSAFLQNYSAFHQELDEVGKTQVDW